MKRRRKKLSNQPKKSLTVDNLKKLVFETHHRSKGQGKGIWHQNKYLEVLEWPIPFFKNYDIIKLWREQKQALKDLGFGMRKENNHFKLYFKIDDMYKLKDHHPRQPIKKDKSVSNPCPLCESQLIHPGLYYYECSNDECNFAYTFDPSNPNKENQIKHCKKKGIA